jgi:hypothetical protein
MPQNQGIILSSDTSNACYVLRIDSAKSYHLYSQSNAFTPVSSTSTNDYGGWMSTTAITLTQDSYCLSMSSLILDLIPA